uniref:Integral membrane protein n=1 Tax=Streptomyces sp. NBC_01401 TaxID=2903854 RepID=A0AAU3GW34_9ACTN
MHGYGYPPERRPSSSTLVTLRVVFASLTVLSCGFLAWAAMLRLAIVTRRQRDWWLFGLVLALNIGLMGYVGSLPDEGEMMKDSEETLSGLWMFLVVAGTVAYYLYADIRHFARPRGLPPGPPRGPSVGPQAGPQVNPYAGGPYGAGQPGATPAFPSTPSPRSPSYGYPPAPQPGSAPTPPASASPTPPVTPADGPRTGPQRLDQVRAELDELSDYLRKEGDGK